MSLQKHIFISYRRADSADVTGRIYDRLVGTFGQKTIFKDVDSIPLGVNFKKFIDDIIKQCQIVLVVIGKDWLNVVDENGNKKLESPTDLVRIEILSALERNIPIIPLLINNTSMPLENELPEILRPLIYRNGAFIRRDPDFHNDMDRLIRSLSEMLTEKAIKPLAQKSKPQKQGVEKNILFHITTPIVQQQAPNKITIFASFPQITSILSYVMENIEIAYGQCGLVLETNFNLCEFQSSLDTEPQKNYSLKEELIAKKKFLAQKAMEDDDLRSKKGKFVYRDKEELSYKADINSALNNSNTLIHMAENDLLTAAEREFLNSDMRLIFTNCKLADNWFSHWHPGCKTAIVSLNEWSLICSLPVSAFIAYEIILHGLKVLGPDYYPMEQLFHAETRGCLFDICYTKQDIRFKLLSGIICDRCCYTLLARGVDPKPILRMVEIVNLLAKKDEGENSV